ncbi:beta-glucosidase [Flavobacterium album]|uniref:Beta-glucosidase n=1 Tax=Flavobacterium album TaxID=2175091 RepID=A0A2S1QW70_9FLAO|nr:GH1 family beta-glucosidase [Flavobacterium album]AWH84662.1 beta-glucosidase [Flavobacterium album]
MELNDTDLLSRDQFGESFKWGVSTAAYQIEGGHDTDEKGLSIWDIFTAKSGSIANGHNANIACDFYNRYPEDIALVKELNIPNLRFSLSWPRIMPEGTGKVNQKGIDFYNRVIDSCLENGIEPWITLYHWDLPHELEMKGGWVNRDIISWFAEYVEVCAKNFGDRVKHWMVMNEPMVFTGAGYFMGLHAPGKKGLPNFLPAAHHAILSMAEGGRVLRNLLPDAEIGTTFSCSYIEPYTAGPKDFAAAKRADALLNRLFIEPVLGLGYPREDLPVLKKLHKYIQPGDEEKMKFDFDFIGVQNYTREVVKHSIFVPYLNAVLVKAQNRKVPLTAMGWEIYPPSIYHMLKKYGAYEGVKKIYITENGAAFTDQPVNGEVKDDQRIQYINDHLKQVLNAKNEGVNVRGYFVWTLLDNFEWAEGYHPRFGLVHVDFDTQQRIIKASGHWYKSFLQGQ